METPETYESINLKPDAPRGCPWKNTIVPGPMAGQITFKTVPCQKEHCAMWISPANVCSLSLIAPALIKQNIILKRINDHLTQITEYQRDHTALILHRIAAHLAKIADHR